MKKPLVVGYKGEIGFFILGGLLRVKPKAMDILCVDVNEEEHEIVERIEESDIIFLCVPMINTVEWLVKYKMFLTGKTIVEQCSLKEWIYNDRRLKNLNIISMHVLFRPSATPNLSDRRVGLLLDQDDGPIDPDLIEEITQSEIIWFHGVADHDNQMAIQQALVHRTLLVLGEMISTNDTSTYVGSKVIELCNRIKKGDQELYGLIQGNKHLNHEIELFQDNLDNFSIENYF